MAKKQEKADKKPVKDAEKTNGKDTGGKDAGDEALVYPEATGALPLFYKKPMPLEGKAHKDLGLRKKFSLEYTRKVNAVPINMIEMPQICHFYPIGFAPDPSATPVAIIGLRDNENLFLTDKGDWLPDTYIPAYVRRYPFIFSEMPNSDQLTLCVDLNKDVVESNGEQPFFDKESKPTQLAQNALEFCKSYHAAAQQTIAFGKALHDSGLLVERQAEINMGNDQKINFAGFRIIDEKKLAELDDKTFAEWRKNGWIPFLYAHLFSGAQWQRLTQLLNKRIEKGNK